MITFIILLFTLHVSWCRLATKEQELQILQKEMEEKSRQVEEKMEQQQQVTFSAKHHMISDYVPKTISVLYFYPFDYLGCS